MKNFAKSLISAAVVALIASAPLAASAYTIGVTDSLASSINSSHSAETDSSFSHAQGNEQSNSQATKVGNANDANGNSGYVVDPAQTASKINGNYHETVDTNASSNGTYSQGSNSTKWLTGGQEVDTSLSSSVSTFFNP